MAAPTYDEVRDLAEWESPHGVVSVYLRVDPGDRGAGWRTVLRNGLGALREAGDGLDHERKMALRATAERISERFSNHDRDLPRGEIGFVEVAEEGGAERWWSSHRPPESAPAVAHADGPLVAPLLAVSRWEALRGVALLSAERVRLVAWRPGHLEELHDWEMGVFMDQWRDHRSQRVPNPARAQAVSSSGRDQHDDHLRENRHRFLAECGHLTRAAAEKRGWDRLLTLGGPELRRDFERGFDMPGVEPEAGGDGDLISEPHDAIERQLEESTAELERRRTAELIGRAFGETAGRAPGATGRKETEAALTEGRVETLLFDLAAATSCEELARDALRTGAEVLPVAGEGAGRLRDCEGVAAVLRF